MSSTATGGGGDEDMRKRRGRGKEGRERRRVTTAVTPFQYKYTERRSEASESLEQSSKLVVQLGSYSFTVSPALKRADVRMPPFSGDSRDGGGGGGGLGAAGARGGRASVREWSGWEWRLEDGGHGGRIGGGRLKEQWKGDR